MSGKVFFFKTLKLFKSNHLYQYSALNNTDGVKTALQYQIGT